ERIIQEENGYVSWRLAELVARDCPEALNAVLARLRSDFLPLARLEWLLAFVPHVAPEVAHALWHEACDLFEATVDAADTEALDDTLESLIDAVQHVADASARLRPLLATW